MQEPLLTGNSNAGRPLPSKAYWIQGLEDSCWQNLEHFESGEEAIANIGSYVGSNNHDELRLVSATFQPSSEEIEYRHLATIANGKVTRPENRSFSKSPKTGFWTTCWQRNAI